MEVTVTVMEQVDAGAMLPLDKVMLVLSSLAVNEAEAPQPDMAGENGSARKTFVGRESVRDAWVRVVLGRLFLMVIVSRLVPPAQMVDGLKLFPTSGVVVPSTFRVALAGLVLLIFVPPPVELRAPTGIVLIRLPLVSEDTLTVTVHEPGIEPDCGGTVPPVSVMVVAVVDTVPPQLLVIPGGLATRKPGWTPTRLSIQDVFESAKILGLNTVMLRTETWSEAMEIGVNFLLISAGRVMAWARAA